MGKETPSETWRPPEGLPQKQLLKTAKEESVVREWVAQSTDEALQRLVDGAVSTSRSSSIRTRRSKTDQGTPIIRCSPVAVEQYLSEVAEVARIAKHYMLPKLQTWIEVVADLRCIEIAGQLHATIDNIDVYFGHADISGLMSIRVHRTAWISITEMHMGPLEIAVIKPGQLHLSLNAASLSGFSLSGPNSAQRYECSTNIVAFEAKFLGDVSIKDMHLKNSNLSNATFESKVDCERCYITSPNLTKAVFSGSATFKECNFIEEPAIFLNGKFLGSTLFDECTFVRPPDFHGADLHQGTRFANCDFVAAGSLLYSKCEVSDISAYRVLKSHFARQKDTRQELMFYALEQRGDRFFSKGDPAEIALSWIQDAVSNYGQSVSRPLIFFFGWIVLFGLIYAFPCKELLSMKPSVSEALSGYTAISLSLQNSLVPLVLFSEKGGIVHLAAPGVYLLSMLQGLLSYSTLIIFALAIKAKFKKGAAEP